MTTVGTRTVTGRIWLFGDDMNTDVIHPPSFFSLDPEKVKRGLFHGYDPTIQPNIQPDDIIVAGRNFGCGSSRETSIRAIKLNQIGAVIAVDFGRIFFRNATNS
jgi:3-isopropylmalate/(R)-2-methylmalate dehydratase small subunit